MAVEYGHAVGMNTGGSMDDAGTIGSTTAGAPAPLVPYRNIVMDNARWEGFEFRDGDIVISTPPKCGTTWTQTICALLIFGSPVFPRALDLISPWLDQLLRRREDVIADLAAQDHRRFIKTHTPLDGLPIDDRVTYLHVGRDPRDVAISWANHVANIDSEVFFTLRRNVVGIDELDRAMTEGDRPPELTEQEWFWAFVDEPQKMGGPNSVSLASVVHHAETFWTERHRPNIVMLHYSDLSADLPGQMRALAATLGIEVSDDRWDELVEAATFERMRARASEFSPNATEPIWRDTARFFNRGTSGQWRHLVHEDGLGRYWSRVRALTADDALAQWIHSGSTS